MTMMRSLSRTVLLPIGAIFASVIAVWPNMAADAATEPTRVLLLHPTDLLTPGTVEQDAITRKALTEALPQHLEFYSEGFDEYRSVGPAREAEIIALLAKRFATRRPHLIVFHGPMHDIVSRNRHNLWPGVPIMFASVAEHRLADPAFPHAIPGTSARFDLPGTVDLAMQLQPEARRLIVLTGDSTYDRSWQVRAPALLAKYRERLALELIAGERLEELTRLVSSLKPDSIVIFLSMYRDASDRIHAPREVAQQLSAHSRVPIYVVHPGLVGLGTLGGSVVNWSAQGDAIGEIARRLLAGEPAETVRSPAPIAPVCKVDWRRLEHWGISVDRVPQACQILFREPSFWVRYATETILIALIVLGQAALITTLLMQRRQRRLAALEAERQNAELAHATRLATLGELSASIAHEINQPLFAILTNATVGEALLAAEHPRLTEIKKILGEIRRDDERASDVIRKLRELLQKRPVEMRPLDVNETMNSILQFLGATGRHRGVTIQTEPGAALPTIHGDRVQLEQVLLNLVMNAIEAMAESPLERRWVTVRTTENPEGWVEVSVSDHGPGIAPGLAEKLFDPFFTTKREGMGLGLSIARSIVQAHDGRLWVEPRADGATFRFVIPAKAVAATAAPKRVERELNRVSR
jgi:signal transduction histidine kinase